MSIKKSKVSTKEIVKNEVTIPIYPPLYIFNNNNKVYEWNIEIKLKEPNIYTIITKHGEKDGKMVSHEKDITEGKVKRSVLEQAILDANRKWLNKKDKELYVEVLENNTSKSEVVRPMLANTFSFNDYLKKSRAFKISFPAYIQRKYDGIRCIAYLKNDNVLLESRKGIPFQNFGMLKNELKSILKKMPSDFYFDGELFTDKLNFEVISGLIRLHEDKVKPEDIELINKIEYHIYDFIDMSQKNLPYINRLQYLTQILDENTFKNSLCKKVDTILIDKLEDVKTYHQKFIEEGYEGLMLRDLNGPYEINKRSKYLQKYKEFFEEEFDIIGFSEGTGDEKGCVIWECITNQNKTFNVRPVGTFQSRQVLFQNATQYIGKKLTVKFQEYTLDQTPRFGVGKCIRDFE
jgi:DNA ligase-1